VLVSISGLPGSGTSTVGRAVARDLGLDHLDGGQVFRGLAAERGMDLVSFGALAEADPQIDVELDRRLGRRAAEGDVVLESRLAGWILTLEGHDGLRVWIACDADERARRVAGREGRDAREARAHNDAREASEAVRYHAYYGIDITDLSPYDLVLDSTERPADDLIAAIVSAAGG